VEVFFHALLTLAPDRDQWSASSPGCFIPGGKSYGTHWIGGWMNHRDGPEAVVKRKHPCLYWESNPGRLCLSLDTILPELSRNYEIKKTVWLAMS